MKIVSFEFRKSQSTRLTEVQIGIIYCTLRVNGTASKPFSTGVDTQKHLFKSSTKEIAGDLQKTEMLRRIESAILRLHNLYPDFTADQLKDLHQQGGQASNPLLLELYAQFFEWFELTHDNEESIRTYRQSETALKKYLAHIHRPNYTANEVSEAFLSD